MPRTSFVPQGKLIRELRENGGLSREALASKIGCHTRTIENVEAGKRVSMRTLQELAQAFKLLDHRALLHTAGDGELDSVVVLKIDLRLYPSIADALNELEPVIDRLLGKAKKLCIEIGSLILTLATDQRGISRLHDPVVQQALLEYGVYEIFSVVGGAETVVFNAKQQQRPPRNVIDRVTDYSELEHALSDTGTSAFRRQVQDVRSDGDGSFWLSDFVELARQIAQTVCYRRSYRGDYEDVAGNFLANLRRHDVTFEKTRIGNRDVVRIPDIETRSDLAKWMSSRIMHEVVDLIISARAQRRGGGEWLRLDMDLDMLSDASLEEPLELVQRAERRDALNEAIDTLDDRYRSVIRLQLDGLTSVEISERLKMSVRNVRVLARRALSRLTELLRSYDSSA